VGVALTKRAIGSILHHQKRRAIFDCEIEYPNDVGMGQACKGARFFGKTFHVLVIDHNLKDLYSGLAVEIDMLSKVDFGKAAPSQETKQPVVPYLLPFAVSHLYLPLEDTPLTGIACKREDRGGTRRA